MGLAIVTETLELFQQKKAALTERDRDFVVQFAFRTDDRELTEKLIDELMDGNSDRDAVCRKYQALVGAIPDWVQRIENLLISLEMYRAQEEYAVRTLSELLSAYGIPISEEEIRRTDITKVQERIKKEASL